MTAVGVDVAVELDLVPEQGALGRVVRALTFAPYSIASLSFIRDGGGIGIDRAAILLDLDDTVTSGSVDLLQARLDRLVVVLDARIGLGSSPAVARSA